MKLQVKLALYNIIIKLAIVAILSGFILVFMNRISVSHIQHRLITKRNKLIDNLSDLEIKSLLTRDKSFTDYNILKDEYIILTKLTDGNLKTKQLFTQDDREIEGSSADYQILTETFRYKNANYRLEIGETTQAVKEIENTVLFYAIVVLCVAIALTLITDLAFLGFLLSPLYQIIDLKIDKVNDPINYDYRPIETSTEDFRILDTSINSLMRKISDLFISEKQFIANVSHEFLTPISVLSSRLENLLSDEKLSVGGETKIFASLKTLNRLKAIINSLLLISRVENNQFQKKDTISLSEVLNEVKEELSDRLLFKNLTLNIKVDSDFVFNGNRSLIETLIINLINNAIKYNSENGYITVSNLAPNHGVYTLLISDTGIGMEADQVKNVFVRFEKLNSIKTDSFGLGLAIVKSIANFHDINITISSETGIGTDVYLHFNHII
ncbi:MAG: histidine kinase [Daejeonella sp.]|nr:histidine kinase [Daejeonella sp.]